MKNIFYVLLLLVLIWGSWLGKSRYDEAMERDGGLFCSIDYRFHSDANLAHYKNKTTSSEVDDSYDPFDAIMFRPNVNASFDRIWQRGVSPTGFRTSVRFNNHSNEQLQISLSVELQAEGETYTGQGESVYLLIENDAKHTETQQQIVDFILGVDFFGHVDFDFDGEIVNHEKLTKNVFIKVGDGPTELLSSRKLTRVRLVRNCIFW